MWIVTKDPCLACDCIRLSLSLSLFQKQYPHLSSKWSLVEYKLSSTLFFVSSFSFSISLALPLLLSSLSLSLSPRLVSSPAAAAAIFLVPRRCHFSKDELKESNTCTYSQVRGWVCMWPAGAVKRLSAHERHSAVRHCCVHCCASVPIGQWIGNSFSHSLSTVSS